MILDPASILYLQLCIPAMKYGLSVTIKVATIGYFGSWKGEGETPNNRNTLEESGMSYSIGSQEFGLGLGFKVF